MCNFNFLANFLLFTFFLEFAQFFPFFSNKNYQVRKIQNKEDMLVGEGGFNPTI
jgi:hypothetical protein